MPGIVPTLTSNAISAKKPWMAGSKPGHDAVTVSAHALLIAP
jgi:hypothetical protein